MTQDFLKRRIAKAVSVLQSNDRPPTQLVSRDDDDPGFVAPDSPVRKVHGDPAMFVGGVRALLFQTLHPVAMYAVAEHSDYLNDPLGRLHRTGDFIGSTTFGTAEQARQAFQQVRTIHARVTGIMPDGTIYRADDPHLLGWVHATEVDSFLTAYQRYGAAPLTASEADRYVADMAVLGEELGMDEAPRTRAELAAMLDMYRRELAPSPECRRTTRFLFAPSLPITLLPFYGLVFSGAAALLPAYARSMLLLPVAPGIDPFLLRPAVRAITSALRWAYAPGPEGEDSSLSDGERVTVRTTDHDDDTLVG